ncbi:hypothetical protein [Neomegalonema perideroedes]|uniref:hypothetical protein n=1 Tax=Neomegalonema perideroedes TaxID=217219 RepID=UPI00039F0EB2|nr:hypothetical protein [Neomegalonema perideroedes]
MFKRNPATTLALAAAFGLAAAAPTVANEALSGAFGGASGLSDLRVSIQPASSVVAAAPIYNPAPAPGVGSAPVYTPSASSAVYAAPVRAASPTTSGSPYPGLNVVPADSMAARPSSTQKLDMSGADGSLRACYANGGMAQQSGDLSYFCNYEPVSAEPSPYITPPDVETGYTGTKNALDATIQDCIVRGGSLAQLTNQNYVCVM